MPLAEKEQRFVFLFDIGCQDCQGPVRRLYNLRLLAKYPTKGVKL